jgi:hypothetical protein
MTTRRHRLVLAAAGNGTILLVGIFVKPDQLSLGQLVIVTLVSMLLYNLVILAIGARQQRLLRQAARDQGER